MAMDDAVSERHARAAASGHPDGVHAAAEEQPPRLRRFAQQEGAVGREALGAVQQHLHTGGFQRRQPVQRVPHHRLEVVPVLGQQLEGEVLAETVRVDGSRARLEAADQQAARIVTDVEMPVVIRQRRHVARDAVDRLGEQVEVLARPDRNLDPGHGGCLAAPQARAERDGVAAYRAPRGLDAGDTAVRGQNAGHTGVLVDPRAPGLGALDESGAQIRRADPSVVGGPHDADDIVRVHQRPAFPGFADRNGPGADAEQVCQRLLAPDVDEPILAGGDRERALVDPARRLSGLLLELRVEGDGVADEIGEVAGGAQGPHLGGGMPGGAGGQAVALEQDGIGDAGLGEVIQGRASHDATADDDDGRVCGKDGVRHEAPRSRSRFGARPFDFPSGARCPSPTIPGTPKSCEPNAIATSFVRPLREHGHVGRVAYTPAMNGFDPESALDRLRGEPDPQRRRLAALGVLTMQLSAYGIEPILVGGGALDFYTAGGYATKDMDLALPAAPEVDGAFAALGFEKEGRYWFHPELDLLFEAPAPAGLPGEDAPRTEVEIDGLRVVIIGIEDLLIDRLRAWVHWNSTEDGRWTRRLALLYPDRIDWDYVRERTSRIPEEAEALGKIEKEALQC